MHSGFSHLRSALPMNLKAHYPGFKVWAGAQADVDRIAAIWRECLAESGGPFLFGAKPCVADAMFAPVCTRFVTYDVKLDAACAGYCKTIMALPQMQEWIEAAKTEPEELEELDVEFDQSSFAPERSTTPFHFAESFAIVSARSCGVPPAGSSPMAANRVLNPSDRIARFTAALSLSTMALRQSRGSDQAGPGRCAIARHARLRDGRQVRERRRSLVAAHRERPDLAGLGGAGNAIEALEHQIDVPGDQVVDRRRAAPVRHVLDLRAGHEFEQLAADMAGRAIARRRVGELARIGLGLLDQLLHRLDVRLRRYREHQMPVHDQRDRLEILLDDIGQLRHHVAGDRHRADRPDARACSRRVATWRRNPCQA